jgi:tRNA(His) 5'-end guanylyltransferase
MKDSKDSLGDRMKEYESTGTSNRLMPLLPVMIRLDGVAFHTFTKGLKRPYDERLSKLMIDTTKYLVKLTNARVGYTQSDEISLVLISDDFASQTYFDAKVYKILSVLAARTSVYFNQLLPSAIPEKRSAEPVFDCRVWNVPNRVEAANTLLWREQDASRNSVSMAAQSLYSHKELQGKSCNEMQEMIFQKSINWNDYPAFFKRGTYIRRIVSERPFTATEIEKLPARHKARTNSALTIERTDYAEMDYGPLSKIGNRAEVLFEGAEPVSSLG